MDGECISNKMDTPKTIRFLTFWKRGRVLAKTIRDRCMLIIITLVWPFQPSWYTQLLRMSIQDSIFFRPFPNFLIDPSQH